MSKKEHLSVLSNLDRKVIDEVTSIHESDSSIFATAVVGSIARGVVGYRDIDLLILHNYSNEGIIERYKKLFAEKKPYILDDALRFNLESDHELSLVYKQEKPFFSQIQSILAGYELERVIKTWAAGGFISEVLLSDISQAIILLDKMGTFQKLVDTLTQYPESFRAYLISFLSEEINQKLPILETDSKLISMAAALDIQIAALRLIFALNHEFFPGFKRIRNEAKHWNSEDQSIIKSLLDIDLYHFDKKLINSLLKKAKYE